ncbi:hypothetical protein QJS66_06870 [Kocuria rhizophila]|nr:hypothetical protein QJS66_06870 [Kocuria rhizophila]
MTLEATKRVHPGGARQRRSVAAPRGRRGATATCSRRGPTSRPSCSSRWTPPPQQRRAMGAHSHEMVAQHSFARTLDTFERIYAGASR